MAENAYLRLVKGVVRAGSPLIGSAHLGEIPPAYSGLVVPHKPPWKVWEMEPAVYSAHFIEGRAALAGSP